MQHSLYLLKAEKSLKVGIKAKRLKCGWSHDYLLKVLLVPNQFRCVGLDYTLHAYCILCLNRV